MKKTAPQVGIIIGNEADKAIMKEAEKVLIEYGVPFEVNVFKPEQIKQQLANFAKNAHSKGICVIIAGTAGDFNFTATVADSIAIPVVGVPMRSTTSANNLESVFRKLQQPLPSAIATVALDSGQNAGILAVQILATNDAKLMKKILDFKENLKNKILKANEEMSEIKFDYRTN